MKFKGNLRLLKIEVPRGGSDVGAQYSIHTLPTLWLYEGGEIVSTETREIIGMLSQVK